MDYNKFLDKGFELLGKAVILGKEGKAKLDEKVAELSEKAEPQLTELGKKAERKIAEVKEMIDAASENLAEGYNASFNDSFHEIDTGDFSVFLVCWGNSYNNYNGPESFLDVNLLVTTLVDLAKQYNAMHKKNVAFPLFVRNEISSVYMKAVDAYWYVAMDEDHIFFNTDPGSNSSEHTLLEYYDLIERCGLTGKEEYMLKELIAEIVDNCFDSGKSGTLNEVSDMLVDIGNSLEDTPLDNVKAVNVALLFSILHVEYRGAFIVNYEQLEQET